MFVHCSLKDDNNKVIIKVIDIKEALKVESDLLKLGLEQQDSVKISRVRHSKEKPRFRDRKVNVLQLRDVSEIHQFI